MGRHRTKQEFQMEREVFEVGLEVPIPFEELIKLGGYGYVEPLIAAQAKLKTKPVEVARVTLVQFVDQVPESRYVPGLLKREGLRSATLYELASFGWKHPEEQLKSMIHAYGDIDRSEINLKDYTKARGGTAYGTALSNEVEGRGLIFSTFYSAIQLVAHPARQRYGPEDRYAAVEISAKAA